MISFVINFITALVVAVILGFPFAYWIFKRKMKKLKKKIPDDIQEKLKKEKIMQKEVENDRTTKSEEYFRRRKEEQRVGTVKGKQSIIDRDTSTSGNEEPVEESGGVEISEPDSNTRDSETIELHKPTVL